MTKTNSHASPMRPPVVVFISEGASPGDWRKRLESEMSVVEARSWTSFLRLAPRSDAALILTDGHRPMPGGVAVLRSRQPEIPVLLVTDPGATRARTLLPTRVDAILWPQEVSSQAVLSVIRRSEARRVRQQLRALVEADKRLDAAVQNALSLLLSTPQPIAHSGALCELLGISRTTLWRRWSAQARSRSIPTIADAIGAVLLTRAWEGRHRGATWSQVTVELGLELRRVSRLSARLLHAKVRDLSRLPASELERTMAAYLLGPETK